MKHAQARLRLVVWFLFTSANAANAAIVVVPLLDGSGSDVIPGGPGMTLAGIYSNTLRTPGSRTFAFEVRNDGGSDTTYSIILSGAFTDPDPFMHTQQPIQAGQLIERGAEFMISTDQPSGLYAGNAVVHNDMNPMDSDENVFLEYEIYDPPVLTQNGPTINPLSTPQLLLGNAPAGPHPGALRALVRVTQVNLAGSGFTLLGPGVGSTIGAGQSLSWTAGYNPAGGLSGKHFGSVTVRTEMFCPRASYLNGAQPVPAAVWHLSFDQPDHLALNQSVAAGQNFAAVPLYVNNSATAAVLAAGQSSSAQTVTMQLGPDPEAGAGTTATILGSAVELLFSAPGDVYVLGITYDSAALPPGLAEQDLRLLAYDPAAGRWELAIAANSDGGSGATLLFESFPDYQADLAGGVLELSTQGVDLTAHQVWAVLDNATVFATGVIVPEPASAALLAVALSTILLPRAVRGIAFRRSARTA